jgi:hypothetical protein
MPSHRQKLYYIDDCDNDPSQDIQATCVDGRWNMTGEVEIWSTESLLDVFLFLSSLLWISARYKSQLHGSYHLRISVNGSWSFPFRHIRGKVTLCGTDPLWDLLVCMIAYAEWLFDCLLPFVSISTLGRDDAGQEVCT